MAFFPGFPSVPLLYCSFRSKFRCFCQLTGSTRPARHALSFEDTTQGSLHLVAQFVGYEGRACGLRNQAEFQTDLGCCNDECERCCLQESRDDRTTTADEWTVEEGWRTPDQ